jgi:hypothetical protein
MSDRDQFKPQPPVEFPAAAEAPPPSTEQSRIALVAAALPASFTAPRMMSWDERIATVTEVLQAAAAVDQAVLDGTLALDWQR